MNFIPFSVEIESKCPEADQDDSLKLPYINSNIDWWGLDDQRHSKLGSFDSYPDTTSTSEREMYNFTECMDSGSDSGISVILLLVLMVNLCILSFF